MPHQGDKKASFPQLSRALQQSGTFSAKERLRAGSSPISSREHPKAVTVPPQIMGKLIINANHQDHTRDENAE